MVFFVIPSNKASTALSTLSVYIFPTSANIQPSYPTYTNEKSPERSSEHPRAFSMRTHTQLCASTQLFRFPGGLGERLCARSASVHPLQPAVQLVRPCPERGALSLELINAFRPVAVRAPSDFASLSRKNAGKMNIPHSIPQAAKSPYSQIIPALTH